MKSAIVLCTLVAYAFAASVSKEEIPIIKQESEVNFDGSYYSSYETGNGIVASEQGSVREGKSEVTGSFKYVGDDGVTYMIEYIANENGFQPKGAHIPVVPQIPAAISGPTQLSGAAKIGS